MLHSEMIDILSVKLPFWKQLTIEQQDLIRANSRRISFQKGDILHRGDADCSGLLYVESGTLRVEILSEEGREITLYRLDSGNLCVFSATCMLDSIDFDVIIEADSDCEVIQLDMSTMAAISADNVYVELFTYKLAAERFSDIMWAMQQMLFTSFDKRLAGFLIDESIRIGSNNISLTQDQIAKYLGSAREVVSRMLNYFAKEGYISLYRGGVHIIDIKKLREIL